MTFWEQNLLHDYHIQETTADIVKWMVGHGFGWHYMSIWLYKGIILNIRHDVYKTIEIVKYIEPQSGVQTLRRVQYTNTSQMFLILENRYQIPSLDP